MFFIGTWRNRKREFSESQVYEKNSIFFSAFCGFRGIEGDRHLSTSKGVRNFSKKFYFSMGFIILKGNRNIQ